MCSTDCYIQCSLFFWNPTPSPTLTHKTTTTKIHFEVLIILSNVIVWANFALYSNCA